MKHEDAETPSGEPAPTDADRAGVARRCVACGYNLFGLGEEPRCPECGLVNIPDVLRQQVWDLVDQKRWFFSGPLAPFAKRLPGWWWALDREGDLRASFKVAIRNILVAAAILVAGVTAADMVRTESGPSDVHYDRSGQCTADRYVLVYGLWGRPVRVDQYAETVDAAECAAARQSRWRNIRRVFVEWAWPDATLCAALLVAAMSVWAGPALVGLCTQIRKGLPDFARAPRTIMAASNLESHRLIYLAIAAVLSFGIDVLLSVFEVSSTRPVERPVAVLILSTGLLAYGALGWTGPLRSDYTRQLVRSRRHAIRIVVMYAALLPPLVGWAWGALVWFLANG